jgi:hypothetical protein
VNDYIPTEDVEAPISANFVTAAGFDRAQLTVRGNDAEQFLGRLAELQAAGALETIAEFSALLQEKAGAAAPSAAGAQSGGSPASQRGASSRGSSQSSRGAAAPQSDVEYHPEGLKCSKCDAAVIYKKIKAKTGKTFEMWVCENQRERGDGHHSEFIN